MGSQLTLVGFSAGGTCTLHGQLLILIAARPQQQQQHGPRVRRPFPLLPPVVPERPRLARCCWKAV